MKKTLILLTSLLLLFSCGEKSPKDIPQWGRHENTDTTTVDPPADTTQTPADKPERTEIADYTDMVLLYGYGHHRSPIVWG
ncbi:MAG: hypothetical protein J6T58_05930, partial [Bacteroidales bacterium]|nr:hypothetical protein [Bacteroidales bacterium]